MLQIVQRDSRSAQLQYVYLVGPKDVTAPGRIASAITSGLGLGTRSMEPSGSYVLEEREKGSRHHQMLETDADLTARVLYKNNTGTIIISVIEGLKILVYRKKAFAGV